MGEEKKKGEIRQLSTPTTPSYEELRRMSQYLHQARARLELEEGEEYLQEHPLYPNTSGFLEPLQDPRPWERHIAQKASRRPLRASESAEGPERGAGGSEGPPSGEARAGDGAISEDTEKES